MAEADKKLTIQIVTTVDNSGLKSATAETKEVADADKILKKETEAVTDATKEQSLHLEGSGKVFSVLNKIVPELGHKLHAAFMGPLGPLVLLGFAIAEVKKEIAEYDKQLDELTETELAQHSESVKNVKKAWDEAQSAVASYQAALKTSGQESDPIKKQLDGIRAVADAEIEASRRVIEALGRQEIAYLRAHGATPEQIESAEARQQIDIEKLNAQKERTDGIDALKLEQATRTQKAPELEQQARTARAEANQAKEEFDRKQDEMQRLRAALDPSTVTGKKLSGDVEAASKQIEELKQFRDMQQKGSDTYAAYDALIPRAEENLQEKTSVLDRYRTRLSQLESTASARELNYNERSAVATNLEAQSIVNQGRIRQLPDEISQAEKVQGATDTGRKLAAVINERDSQTGKTLGEMGAAAHLNQSQIIEIARRLLSGQMTHAQAISGMRTLINQLEAQNRSFSMSHR